MKKRIYTTLPFVLAFLMLTSCGNNEVEEATPPVTPPSETVASVVTPPESTPPDISPPAGIKWELADLWGKIDGSTATMPLTAAFYDFLNGGGDWPPEHNTTPNAYYHLIYGSADLIFVTYPSDNEFQMAKEQGVELEIIPVTKDALVFLVNVENPVDNVSLAQLRDVYTGKIQSWNDLTGTDESIIPYQRTADSGSQTLFLKLLMEGQEPMEPPTDWVVASMGSLIETVSNYDNAKSAVGYSMFYYVNNMYGNSRFKLLGIDGVKPTRETITRGEYALEDYYYAVIRKDTPADSPARRLIDWILTDDGQRVAASAGYIPVRPIENVSPDNTVDPIYLGDVENSSGTGGTVLKSPEERSDVVTNGVRKPLSDLFYDGFNYIEYINEEILSQLDRQYPDEYPLLTWGEMRVTSPFTGIPNDYPHYELTEKGYLVINFPENNPFFKHSASFRMLLAKDLSPYGEASTTVTVTYEHSRQITDQIRLFTLSVNLPKRPDVAARINEQLEKWTDTIPGDETSKDLINGFVNWYGSDYYLIPKYGQWRDYLSVSYILSSYDGPIAHMPMLYTICFDMTTGEAVALADVLPRNLLYSNAIVFTPIVRIEEGAFSSQTVFDGYVPTEGSVITEAWIEDETIGLYISEPDGRRLQALFWDSWE